MSVKFVSHVNIIKSEIERTHFANKRNYALKSEMLNEDLEQVERIAKAYNATPNKHIVEFASFLKRLNSI